MCSLPSLFLFFSSLVAFQVVDAFQTCPLLGPSYPAPNSLSTSTVVLSAIDKLKAAIDDTISTGNSSNGLLYPNSTTFSISLFSTLDVSSEANGPFFFQYHHTAPTLSKSSRGVKPVDADSIYRIGGLTQVFTIYAFLAAVGDDKWNEPVTQYVPELKIAASAFDSQRHPTDYVNWDEVTIGQLASHMSGIGRDYGSTDLLYHNLPLSSYGFPPLSDIVGTLCGNGTACSRKDFIASFKKRAPVFLSDTTPIYSNAAFQIISYVLESVTGQSFETILEDKIFHTLKMSGSSLQTPFNSSHAVIPGNSSYSGWSASLGDESPANSMFSTVTDLALAGRSILSSTLLSPAQTRRWLKPASHTSNVVNGVGYPWEIYSSASDITAEVIDIYTKLGTFGHYSSYLGLSPDYNIGFAILAAGDDEAPDLNAYADMIGEHILSAVITAAALEAHEAFGGSYHLSSAKDNSSIMLSVADGLPGISVTSLISDGIDTRAAYATLLNIEPKALSFRLFPTNLRSTHGKFAFRAVFQDMNEFEDSGTPTCVSWMDVDKLAYGGVSLDLFVFELDSEGNAVKVEIPALRKTLDRA